MKRIRSLEECCRLTLLICGTIDVLFQKKRTVGITKTTPLAATIDKSTDFTSTTMLCVNLRFLIEGEIEVLLDGLEEMSEGSNGVQLFQSFFSVITQADHTLEQIVCVTTDGDPAMNPTSFLRSASLDFILDNRSFPWKTMQSAELS
ncbi:hypothetical protein BLNAU_23399 [Blattamonas nauphoetae]|uniref:Uncharacterized protein n=1 Tax=Blattamonas nauphoetae TaxID=2049346 RepID=A0ABQ9WTE8_9EUKA|nr:hypothetical protein BLNAU_23399 [Blattamonas nauphoetae]